MDNLQDNNKTTGFTLAEVFLSPFTKPLRTGFTLAEVLITLGIIGVVAAMTLPALIQNYKKNVASSRIKKFVSVMNQALIYAEKDFGAREDWLIGEMNSSDSADDFLRTYILPYVKNLGIEKRTLLGNNMATLRFTDGSQVSVKIGACYDMYYDINGESGPNESGRDIFIFILCRNKISCGLSQNTLQAFYCNTQHTKEDYTNDEAYNACSSGHAYCSILLERNGYEFPKDYPIRL